VESAGLESAGRRKHRLLVKPENIDGAGTAYASDGNVAIEINAINTAAPKAPRNSPSSAGSVNNDTLRVGPPLITERRSGISEQLPHRCGRRLVAFR
jgi:hypothetical protein